MKCPHCNQISWEKAARLVVSGALLRALLYLGAFMIVVSATVLVIRFWSHFSVLVQVMWIAAVPAIFYLAGWWVRARLKLPQAGGVLTGIGALLVAVDFLAVYQLQMFTDRIDGQVYWFAGSIFCFLLYAANSRTLQNEFFDYITLLAGVSAMVAITRVAHTPLVWSVVAAALAGMAMALTSGQFSRMGERWRGMARASRYLPQVLLPASLALAIFAPDETTWGVMCAFLFAALGYACLAWHHPAVIFAHAAAWTFVGTAFFGLLTIDIPYEGYGIAAAVLACLYLLASRALAWLASRSRMLKQHLKPGYALAPYLAGLGLVAAATLAGAFTLFMDYWYGVAALGLAALILASCTILFRRHIFVLLAGGLWLAPFSLTITRLLWEAMNPQMMTWLMAAWSGLALAYLGLAALLRKLARHAAWLYALAHLLTPFILVGLVVFNGPERLEWSHTPTLIALASAILVYLVSAWIHDGGQHAGFSRHVSLIFGKHPVFIWPTAGLIPVWVGVAWGNQEFAWLGAALAGLGLVYAGLGQVLRLRKSEYRLPLHVIAYGLTALGILFASEDRQALLAALALSTAALSALALVYRRVVETTITALLALWAFQLSLELSGLALHARSLAYALLAGLVYIPIGRLLDRKYPSLARPLYWIGYGLSAWAVFFSLLGRFGSNFGFILTNIPWVGVMTPWVVTAIYSLSPWVLKRHPDAASLFAWCAPLTFAIGFGQALDWIRVPPAYHATAWVGLAAGYLLLERALSRARLGRKWGWIYTFCQPLKAEAAALGMVGLSLTLRPTLDAFTGAWRFRLNPAPVILAQGLSVGLVLLAARLYRRRWPMHLAAWLSFFPYTMGWIAWGPKLDLARFAWPWMGWATVLLALGFALDRCAVRYSHGPYLAGYLLAGWSVIWSLQDPLTHLYTLGAVIGVALLSQALVYWGRHHSFAELGDFLHLHPGTSLRRVWDAGFLFLAVYAFPFWITWLLYYHQVSLAWSGLALALIAPLFLATGIVLRRIRREYAWPFFTAAYPLTIIGALLTIGNLELAIYTLILDVVVYAASAFIFRDAFWLVLATFITPVIDLMVLGYHHRLESTWVAGTMMALAFIYLAAGFIFDRRRSPFKIPAWFKSFDWSFYAPAFMLSILALVVGSAEKQLAIAVYLAGSAFYAIAAWLFRSRLLLYPAVWLSGVPYYLGMTLTELPARWYGLGWLPLIAACLALGRWVFHRQPLVLHIRVLANPAMPFYLLGYGLTVLMMAQSGDMLTLALALTASAAIYLESAITFRRLAWLYPGLLAVHLALLAAFAIDTSGGEKAIHLLSLPFLAVTWIMAWAGLRLTRAMPAVTAEKSAAPWRFLRHLTAPSWAQPFFLFAAADIGIWQAVALLNYATGAGVACGYAIFLAVFAMLWLDTTLAYGSLGFILLAAGVCLRWAGLNVAEMLAWLGGIGFWLYWLGRALEAGLHQARLALVWPRPLVNTSIASTGLAVLCTLPIAFWQPVPAAAALAFCGALYLEIAYSRRSFRLGALALAMLELSWAVMLVAQKVHQPLLYAIPTGVYFIGVGYLERRRGILFRRAGNAFALAVESFGLAVLLVTPFIQSLTADWGFPYFVLLLVEGLLVIWWGAAQRLRMPFFIGVGASVLNVVAQVLTLISVYEISRWVILLGVGVLLVVVAVFVERQRERIVARAQGWREALEKWE